MTPFLFDIQTPLDFSVHTSEDYWQRLLIKHPELASKLEEVKNTLQNPVEIRKSKSDEFVFLFYSESQKYWLCAVARKENQDGFLITAYLTDRIKEGEIIWQK